MKNISITFCAYDRASACGGPYAWAADFAAFLKGRGAEIRLLILCSGGKKCSPLFAHSQQLDIPAEVLDTADGFYLEEETEWILQQWSARPSAIFIANLVLPALYAARWIRGTGARTIGVLHSNPQHDPFYADMMPAFVIGPTEWRLDAVVPVSTFIAKQVKPFSSVGLRVETIPCGTRSATSNASWTSGPLRLLYCGRLVQKQKRIRELTEAFLNASETLGVTASICGDGEERSWVEARLAGQDRVKFLGNIAPEKIHEVMANHHVIVLLSDFEGLPMALVEGMACGLVPVCLDEPSGSREVISHGENGLLVQNREQSFMDAVNRLKEPGLWSILSIAARASVESRYTHPVVFAKWANLIQELARGVWISSVRMPLRVSLRAIRSRDRFVGYPACRPSRLQLFRQELESQWLRFRLFVRPRARLRRMKVKIATRKEVA